MMVSPDESMGSGPGPDQRKAVEGSSVKLESPFPVIGEKGAEPLLPQLGRIVAPIMDCPLDLHLAKYNLERLIASFPGQQRPQHLMPTDNRVPGPAKGRYVEFARTDHGRRYHEVTFRAFERAMVLASQRLGSGIVRSLHGGAA